MQEAPYMKKVSPILYVTACIALLVTVGILYLRNQTGGTALLSTYTTPITTAQTVPVTESSFPIDINTADITELMAVPGIGQVYAQRILDYRTVNGPFQNISELLNIAGIGQKRLEAILPYITIGGNNEDTGC
jgi:competence ComEA-like helix-hairpin-helix protein